MRISIRYNFAIVFMIAKYIITKMILSFLVIWAMFYLNIFHLKILVLSIYLSNLNKTIFFVYRGENKYKTACRRIKMLWETQSNLLMFT